jgi:hypothetical protein
MLIQSNQGYQHARKIATPHNIAPALRAVNFDYPSLFNARPKRNIGLMLRDALLIAGGWIFLIGLIAYPAAYLIGLITCALALVFSPTE